jgi:hypothetical protein
MTKKNVCIQDLHQLHGLRPAFHVQRLREDRVSGHVRRDREQDGGALLELCIIKDNKIYLSPFRTKTNFYPQSAAIYPCT